MFGSQTLETAIGLAVMFFAAATPAFAITETMSLGFCSRHGPKRRRSGFSKRG
jgi:hypothetical protein